MSGDRFSGVKRVIGPIWCVIAGYSVFKRVHNTVEVVGEGDGWWW